MQEIEWLECTYNTEHSECKSWSSHHASKKTKFVIYSRYYCDYVAYKRFYPYSQSTVSLYEDY